MEKINFEDGQLTKKGYVVIDGKEYLINEAQYDGATPLSAYVLNKLQDNIEEGINNIQALPTGGTKGQVLTKQSKTEGDANWEDIEANEVYIGNEEEASNSAKIIIEDEDFEEGSTLSKSEVYVGAEEPVAGEKVWFRKGKNHFNGELKAGTFLNGVPNTEMSTTRIRNTEYIGVKNNTDYTISAKYSKILQINVMIYDEDKKFIKEVGWNNVPYTFTTTDTTKYIMFALRESSNANITTKDITQVQVESGSKATSYEAYIEPQIFVRNSNGVYEEFIKKSEEVYSTDEKAIGTWIDGKTIYRKVYHIDTVTGTTQYQLDTNSNIDFITRYSGSIYNPSTGSLYALGSVHSENTSHNYKQLYLNKNEQVLRMDIGDWQTTGGWELYIILEYTKTTD